ncbi:MAG: Spi family protease inhibitor [Bacteroidales bacterium]
MEYSFLIITLFLLISNLSYSNPVDSTLAKKVATNYFSFLNPSRSELEIKNTIVKYYNEYPSYYIVNFNKGGYIAVSANDATIPILIMYSYGGEYIENEFHNPAYLDGFKK